MARRHFQTAAEQDEKRWMSQTAGAIWQPRRKTARGSSSRSAHPNRGRQKWTSRRSAFSAGDMRLTQSQIADVKIDVTAGEVTCSCCERLYPEEIGFCLQFYRSFITSASTECRILQLAVSSYGELGAPGSLMTCPCDPCDPICSFRIAAALNAEKRNQSCFRNCRSPNRSHATWKRRT